MAKLEDVFVVEADRQEPEKWSKIHLFKMGDFWRAYEWSAWLIAVITYNEKVRMTTRDRKPIHVTRMNRTDVEGTYCFVGFPVKSVEKYIPERENFESVDDKMVTITINLPQPNDGSRMFSMAVRSLSGYAIICDRIPPPVGWSVAVPQPPPSRPFSFALSDQCHPSNSQTLRSVARNSAA